MLNNDYWVNLSFLWHLLVLLKILVNRFANLSLAFIKICQLTWFTKYTLLVTFGNSLDTGQKLNVHETFRRCPGRLLNVLCLFNLYPESRGKFVILFRVQVAISCCCYSCEQNHPPEVFYKKCILKSFAKFTGRHQCQSLFLIS